MALVTAQDKFQVTIPVALRERLGLRIGDLLEASVEGEGIVLPPEAIVERSAVAAELASFLAGSPTAPEDAGKPEEQIVEEAIAEVKAARAERSLSSRRSRPRPPGSTAGSGR
ncbi:AbrB/MazE/SpoVT family DNA-binding domain-containing protein [Benzoatithermus flavus]|uniref:AbrB/MazE/SpoVT family DNA-binding domain-containing protein n=1 Tax=Benzoatithermus flavus TaxID=3108223 RepID=A0ABU8XY47_9PROT